MGYFFFVRRSTGIACLPLWVFSAAIAKDENVAFVQFCLQGLLIFALLCAAYVTFLPYFDKTRNILVTYLGEEWFGTYSINTRWVMLKIGTGIFFGGVALQTGQDFRTIIINEDSAAMAQKISEMAVAQGEKPLTAMQRLDYVQANRPTSPFENEITKDICKAVVNKIKGD